MAPGAGAPARLPRLVGRARAIEILVGAEDFDGQLAKRYGYVNRAIPDDEFDDFVTAFATRVSGFDRRSISDIKRWVNALTLPADEEVPPQLDAFMAGVARPEVQARINHLFEQGLQQPVEVEERLSGVLADREVGGACEGKRDAAQSEAVRAVGLQVFPAAVGGRALLTAVLRGRLSSSPTVSRRTKPRST